MTSNNIKKNFFVCACLKQGHTNTHTGIVVMVIVEVVGTLDNYTHTHTF